MLVDRRISMYLEFLSQIPKGTPIEVEWEDASESHLQFYPNDVKSLSNIAVETTQHELGWHLGVRKGRKWRSPYLIFVIKKLDGCSAQSAISSIPLGWVRKIRVLKVVNERKARKNLNETHGTHLHSHRKSIRFTGGVKHLR